MCVELAFIVANISCCPYLGETLMCYNCTYIYNYHHSDTEGLIGDGRLAIYNNMLLFYATY